MEALFERPLHRHPRPARCHAFGDAAARHAACGDRGSDAAASSDLPTGCAFPENPLPLMHLDPLDAVRRGQA